MTESGSEKGVVIRIAQYVVRKEGETLAKDCQIGLVKTVLSSLDNKGLDLAEIVAEIDRQMGLKNFPSYVISDAIDSAIGKEEVYLKNGKYFLENDVYERLKGTINDRRRAIDRFEGVVRNKANEKARALGLDGETENIAVKSVYEFLGNWFKSESEVIAGSLKVRNQIGSPRFPDNLLSTTLRKIKNEKIKQIVNGVITEILSTLETDTGRLLYEILQNYLHLELLNVDPECRHLQRVAFSNKTLVLDTNVLISLFLEAAREHVGISETISIAKDLGVKLVITKRTEQEWLATLESANEQFESLDARRPSLLPSVGDPFILSFFKRKSTEPSLTWQSYYLQLRQIKFLAYERSIGYWYKKEFELEKLPNKEFFEPLWGRVYGCSNIRGFRNPKSRSVCEHDAYHLLLVRKLREESPPDILGPSCWFLTLDSTLLCADDGLNQFLKTPFDPPSSFMADMWVSVISPFLGPEISEDRLAEAFAHLMSTHFATMPTSLDAKAVVETLGSWLPYDKLSNKDVEAILADALVIKYYRELKDAHIKDPSRVEELAARVRETVDQKVFGIFDARISEAEMKEAAAVTEAQNAEREKQKAEKAASEKDKLLVAERRLQNHVLTICLVLGVIFALVGLFILATNNLSTGLAAVICGVTFIALSLGFRHFRIKGGPIELQADR